MSLTTASTSKQIVQAILQTSLVVPVCTPYPKAPKTGSLIRRLPVPANALGWTYVDLTPRRNDPNGVPFASVLETLPVALGTHTFTGATSDICLTAAITAIELAITTALAGAPIVQNEVPGPRARVCFGVWALTKPNINFLLTGDFQVILASDNGPLGYFG